MIFIQTEQNYRENKDLLNEIKLKNELLIAEITNFKQKIGDQEIEI